MNVCLLAEFGMQVILLKYINRIKNKFMDLPYPITESYPWTLTIKNGQIALILP